jgi:hypothetical protein
MEGILQERVDETSAITARLLECHFSEQGWEPFQHTPLDLSSSSIRLVEVLPCSPPDTVRCKMRHATVNEDYACPSYVWGPPDDLCTILIDEQPFQVRRKSSDGWETIEISVIYSVF